MRLFLLCLLVLALAKPAAAQMMVNPGPHEFSGVVVMSDSGLALLTDMGSMSQGQWPLVAQTPEIDAQLKKLIVPEREYPDLYTDVPKVTLKGVIAIVNSRYQFTVDAVSGGQSADAAAQVAALEELANGVKALANAGLAPDARKIGQEVHKAAMILLEKVRGTPLESRLVRLLRSEEAFLIGRTDQF